MSKAGVASDPAAERIDPEEPVEPLLRHLATGPAGLERREAERRLAVHGRNELVLAHKARWPGQLLRQFTHPLALLLLGAGVLALLAGLAPLAVAILVVVILNAGLAFAQELNAERAVDALAAYLPPQARVIRDGAMLTIDAAELVPGDLAIVEEGDRVCADMRLLEGSLEVDVSTLTGESITVSRTADFADAGVPLLEARGLIFSGTTCTQGEARGVVFATGMATQLGRIAALTQRREEPPSPLQLEIRRVAWLIGAIAIGAGAAFVPIGLLAGLPVNDAVLLACALLVANVPEGLLPTITLALAAGVRRLASEGALVKRLNAVETLGATTVICTDKTGTLTENRMRAVRSWSPEEDRDELRLADIAAGANNADLSGEAPTGDPTEIALLRFAAEAGADVAMAERRARRVRQFHFDPRLRRMTVIEQGAGSRLTALCKGAPDAVLDRCRMSPEEHAGALARAEEMAAAGLRVLAFASRELPGPPGTDRDDVESELRFAGLIGLLDPPREGVREAVERCHRAGIRILVVSGDHGLTAAAIAQQVGIGGSDPPVVSGRELDAMSEQELDALLRTGDEIVFARASPEAKLRIADALRDDGHVVAMTGDGVNDAPALHSADIGVAMGRSGTDAAREAATMVLTDDDFKGIVAAVEEGRRVYANIRKFITYIFAHAPAEVIPFLLFALSGGSIPLPLTVMQILAIDLGTETLPALALGRERAEPGVMSAAPRSPEARVIDGPLLRRAWLVLGGVSAVCVIAVFLWVLLRAGWAPGDDIDDELHTRATTMTFLAIVACQVGAALACRTERASFLSVGLRGNPLLLWGIAFEIAFAAAVVWVSPLQAVFETSAPALADLAILLPLPLIVLAADGLYRRGIEQPGLPG
ncbi:MAG: cation-transporting P-type ATPase [Solirubrobacteraceae bacterium]|nr:cation-transporting P-type ATPase [Solirubrobacteraceae bacterium]